MTDNPYVIKGIERNSYPIVCVQGSSSKCIPTETDFIRANKDSFGSAIGSITNKGTAMYDVLAKFEEGTKEHDEILYRLICIQDYQQAEIDKAKGILARPIPKEWYDWKTVKIKEEDSEEVVKEKLFNQSILADKKPYFFIYNYDSLKKQYMDYEKANERTCRVRYGCSVKELMFKRYRTQREEEFIRNYKENAPVSMNDSIMNKLCWMIEEHYLNVKLDFVIKDFDSERLKNPNINYSPIHFNKVALLKEEYDKVTQESIKATIRNAESSYDRNEAIENRKELFKEKALTICANEDVLCNILVDLCYKKSNKSKQFAWELCGERMVENLLNHHDRKISFPIQDDNGDLDFKGMKFKMEEITV